MSSEADDSVSAAQPMPSFPLLSEDDEARDPREPLSGLRAALDAHALALEEVVAPLDLRALEAACEEKRVSAELRARLFSVKSRSLERRAASDASHRHTYYVSADDYCYDAKFESVLSAEIYLAHPDFFFEKCADGELLDPTRVEPEHMQRVARLVIDAAAASDLAHNWEHESALHLIGSLSDRERKRKRKRGNR